MPEDVGGSPGVSEGDYYASRVELLASGRMAEVFALDDERVVKLDRPEYQGVASFEFDVLVRADAAGLPVARAHGLVTIEGRSGIVLDRVHGATMSQVLETQAGEPEVLALAEQFIALQRTINEAALEGLPDLVERLTRELASSGLAAPLINELTQILGELDDGRRGVCHFDFHPDNIVAGAPGWVVIDWVGAASGPPTADLARTLVVCGHDAIPPSYEFLQAVRRHGLVETGVSDVICDQWVRVVAGARLAEGFDGAYAKWLAELAAGRLRLFV